MASAAPRNDHAPATRRARPAKRRWRTWWLKQFHTWHWISAAVSMIGMLLFGFVALQKGLVQLRSRKGGGRRRARRQSAQGRAAA